MSTRIFAKYYYALLMLRSALFICAISAPGLVMIFSRSEATVQNLQENRMPARMPARPASLADLVAIPALVDAYIKDSFGLRRHLVRANALLRTRLLRTGDHDVILGKEGWLFYRTGTVHNPDCIRPYRNAELRLWKDTLEMRQAWATKVGAGFLFLLAPCKASIYPEYTSEPDQRMSILPKRNAFISYMRQYCSVPILDLRDTLMPYREKERLYHKTDSHWNAAGAYYAYTAVVSMISTVLRKPIIADDRTAFHESIEQGDGGDLAQMLGLRDHYHEDFPVFERIRPGGSVIHPAIERAQLAALGIAHPGITSVLTSTGNAESQLNIVFFRDSFSTALLPFLAPHFEQIVYAKADWLDDTLIEHVKPDVIVNEIVDYKLVQKPGEDSAPILEWWRSMFFDEATVCYDLRGKDLAHSIRLGGQRCKIVRSEQGVKLHSVGAGGLLLLPNVQPVPRGGRIVARFEIIANCESQLLLFYGSEGVEGWSLPFSQGRSVRPGRNTVTFQILDASFDGRIALSPGYGPGDYTIESVSVRHSSHD